MTMTRSLPGKSLGRRSGILLHPTSLPGSGAFGTPAAQWLDWLEAAGQSLWQILPLGPPGLHDSPYASPSSFAGDLRLLDADNLPARDQAAELEAFIERHRSVWLSDWTLFQALASRHGGNWIAWPEDLRARKPEALGHARRELADEIAAEEFGQFVFDRQWRLLRESAHRRGIQIVGDLPFYPAAGSADVWAHQHIFDLEIDGRARTVAGVPPDYYSETGQRWGNPVYRWDVLAEDGYRWWIDRLEASLSRIDILRLDHFRAFESYWAVPADAEDASTGEWREGPGKALFDAAQARLGELPLLAEDLGMITDQVRELRRELGVPGMRVLQFAFADSEDSAGSEHLPHRFERNLAVYPGTHDNDTCRGWFAGLDQETRARVTTYLGGGGEAIHWALIRAAWTSVADIAVATLQDVLGLPSEARTNTPGVSEGNWRWRLSGGELDKVTAERLRKLTRLSDRRGLSETAQPAQTAQPARDALP